MWQANCILYIVNISVSSNRWVNKFRRCIQIVYPLKIRAKKIYLNILLKFSSVQFTSVTQLCLTLCDPMNCSTTRLPVHHQLPEFTQTGVHRVRDAIQPSHPRSSPSPPAHNPSQHQSLFQWVNSSLWGGQNTRVSALASFLPKKSQGWSPSQWTGCSPRDSQESSPAPQFKSINSSVLSLLHSPTLTSIHDYWKNHSLD